MNLDSLDSKIRQLISETSYESKLKTFEQMLKDGDLKKVPIEKVVNYSPIFKRMMDLYRKSTDAPDEFLAASGLIMISTILGNQAYIMYGSAKIYPHLWIVLVAHSSYFRKTTALNLAKNAIASMRFSGKWSDYPRDDSDPEDVDSKPELEIIRSGEQLLAPNGFSLASLLEELQKRPAQMMSHSEFASLLTETEKTYNQGAKEFLTDIYDSGRYSNLNKTIKEANKGKPIVVDQAALGIYSATTRHWLQDHVKMNDIGAGFIVRFLFVPAFKKTRSHGWPKTMDDAVYTEIKNEIASLRSIIRGEFDVSAIKPFYELWYHDLMDRAQKEEEGSDTLGFDSRLAIYALKFTMIMHASKYADTKLTLDSLISGIQLAEYFRSKTRELFETTFLSKYDKNIRRIAEYIYQNDHGKTKRQIQQRAGAIGIRGEDFKLTIEMLEEEGDVHWDADGRASISRASKFLKGVIQK